MFLVQEMLKDSTVEDIHTQAALHIHTQTPRCSSSHVFLV